MPTVNITFDKRFESTLTQGAEDLANELTSIICEGIDAQPSDCHFCMVTGIVIGAAPISLTVHFRESDNRPTERVERALQKLGECIDRRFGAAVRLRGFPVYQPTLAAVNYRPADEA